MQELPSEMINEILSHLDKPSLFQASNVCRSWRKQTLLHVVTIDDGAQLFKAAENGDRLSIIKSFYSEQMVNYGLLGACKGGHKELAELMITKGDDDFNSGLSCACRGGCEELAELMIISGADLVNYNQWC